MSLEAACVDGGRSQTRRDVDVQPLRAHAARLGARTTYEAVPDAHFSGEQAGAVAEDLVDGIQRATFGAVPASAVDAWLRQHVRTRLGTDVDDVAFRSGRVNAVFGLHLADGTRVVAKVQRGHLDEERTASLAAAGQAQRLLAAAGYPCPTPLDGPAVTDGLTATVETWLDEGVPGNGHDPATSTAIAASLAEQVQLLESLPADVASALRHPPAWAIYQDGPWPTPHDPIFDFTTTPPTHVWLDQVAAGAAAVINGSRVQRGRRVVGHSDWYCGNLRFATAGAVRVVAAWDWDSLVCEVEPVIAGMAAASFTDSSTSGAQCPTPEEVRAFLVAYDASRARPFTESEQEAAAAAVTWTLAYNARCLVDVLALGYPLPAGPTLHALAEDAGSFMRVRW